MDCSSLLTLPIINFSIIDLKPGSPEWETVKLQVKEALEEFGCFEAVFDKVTVELYKQIHVSLKELFDLPVSTKLYNKGVTSYRGYFGQHPQLPLYEALGISEAPTYEEAEIFTNRMWPEGNASFCKTICSYSKQLSELDQVVRRMVLESFSVEKYLDEHIASTRYLLGVAKYQAPQTNESKLGLGAHADKNIVTILSQNQVHGLGIQKKDGQWLDVKFSLNKFVVMIGDAFMAWTNGRLHVPVHRVMVSGNEDRYSTGLFSVPKPGYLVKAPEELVDEEHPLLFKAYDHFKYLEFAYKAETEGCKTDLKTFSGV